MSIKNRFFKTTIGVAFELSGGALPGAYADYPAFVAAAPAGTYQAFAKDGTKADKGIIWGTALTDVQKRMPIYVTYSTEVSGGVATVESTTPFIGETIRAINTPYAAPTLEVAEVAITSGTTHIGQEVTFRVIETTPLNDILPTWDWMSTIRVSLTASLAEIAAQINRQVGGEFFTATSDATSITITSTDANRHFRLAVMVQGTVAFPDDTTWTYTVTTPAFAGSGTPDQIAELMFESDVKRGITTQYPHDGMAPGDFSSNPLSPFVTGDSDIVVLIGTKYEASPTPIEIHHNKGYIFMIVPAGDGQDIADTFNT